MPDPCAGVVVVVVLGLGETVDVVVGGTAEAPVEVGEHIPPLAVRLRFPQDHVVAPAAVARPDFRRPVVGKILHIDLDRHGIKVGLHAQVFIEQSVHDPVGGVVAFFDNAVIGDEVEHPPCNAMVFFHELLVYPGADVVDAHVLAVDEYNAWPKPLVIDVHVFLRQVLA